MSIREAAFRLCKTVPSMPAQAKLVEQLSTIRNTTIEYLGSKEQAQACGYLVLDARRVELAAPPRSLKIEALPPECRDVLLAYHHTILALNNRCITPLTDALPICSPEMLSPYNRLQPIPDGMFTALEFFPEREVDELVEEFHKHPLISLAIDVYPLAGNNLTESSYVPILLKIEDEIKQSLPSGIPKQVKYVLENVAPTSSTWLELQYLAVLTGIRASLGILNQLLYTRALISKLPCLSSKNIIKFGVYHFRTGAAKLVYQETGETFLLEKEDIIVARDIPPKEERTNFCRVERLSPFITPMPGQPRYVEFIEIDENLNPYRRVFSEFYRA